MPTLEDILPELRRVKVFSTLDTKDGFYQIRLDEESSKKTTFWTPFDRYRYLRMPFAISVTAEENECKLQEKPNRSEGVKILRDDLLAVGYGDAKEEADANPYEKLRKHLDRSREVKLKLNNKTILKKLQIKFMGHVISKDGLNPDPHKVKAVETMPGQCPNYMV